MKILNHLKVAIFTALVTMASSSQAQSDLEVIKSVDESSPVPGNPVEFTITLTNNGPDTATGIELTDKLPADLEIPTGTAAFTSQGDYDPLSGTWQIGDLQSSQQAILTVPAIAASTDEPACFLNTASVSNSSESDPQPSNNEASAAVLAGGATLCAELNLTVTTEAELRQECFFSEDNDPLVGDRQIFSAEVFNRGPNTAQNVAISLTGTHNELAERILINDRLTFNEIAAGETVSGIMWWAFPCGQEAQTITYNVRLTTSTLLSSSSITVSNGQANFPYTGRCDCAKCCDLGGGPLSDSSCFIATAAYGSHLHPHVAALRAFRDRYLLTNSAGRRLVQFYYRVSPPIAGVIASSDSLSALTRGILTPVIYSVVYPLHALLLIAMASLGGVLVRKRYLG